MCVCMYVALQRYNMPSVCIFRLGYVGCVTYVHVVCRYVWCNARWRILSFLKCYQNAEGKDEEEDEEEVKKEKEKAGFIYFLLMHICIKHTQPHQTTSAQKYTWSSLPKPFACSEFSIANEQALAQTALRSIENGRAIAARKLQRGQS